MQKITQFLLQRCLVHHTLHQPLNRHHVHALHDPWAKCRLGSSIRVHISSLKLHTHSHSHDHMWSYQPRANGITSQHHLLSFSQLHAFFLTETPSPANWHSPGPDWLSSRPQPPLYYPTHSHTILIATLHSHWFVHPVVYKWVLKPGHH